jgi:hypothetical protein
MRAYISGKITTKQDFVLQNIWFANDEAEDTDIPSENCVGIEAENFETMFDETDPTVFHCRWKGVFLVTADEDGEETYTDDWTAADLVSLINEKNLTIRNLSGFVDEDTNVVITAIKLEDEEGEFEFSEQMLEMEPIEFYV